MKREYEFVFKLAIITMQSNCHDHEQPHDFGWFSWQMADNDAVCYDGYRSRVILVVLLMLKLQLLSQMRGPHTFVYVVASNIAL